MINPRLLVKTKHGDSSSYSLRGVIYYGQHHFTCRFISRRGVVWYHNGIATGSSLVNEGFLSSVDLSICGTQMASVALYTLPFN